MGRALGRPVPRALASLPVERLDPTLDVVFKLSDRITVMAAGRVLADGSPSEIERNERVQEVYFGGVG